MGSPAAALPSPHCSFLPPLAPLDHFPSRHFFSSLSPHSIHPLLSLSLILQHSDSVAIAKRQQIWSDVVPGAQASQPEAPLDSDFRARSDQSEQGSAIRKPRQGRASNLVEGSDQVTSTLVAQARSDEDAGLSSVSSVIRDSNDEVSTADSKTTTAKGFEEEELVARFAKQVALDRAFKPANWSRKGRQAAKGTVFQGQEEVDANFPSTRSSRFKAALSEASVPAAGCERLPINLDLDLYRAKCSFREGEHNSAEAILRRCIKDWPTDGRAYVMLGSRLMKQGKFVDARAVFEDGCQAARGENAFIWQAWAILEEKLGHISQARKLFDAATAADLRHAAAWHGWAVLELRQGSVRKARDLLSKGLKYCGGNEYLFQTSALIEYKAGKIPEARAFFKQATKYNPKSCASWLAWALLEAEQGNNPTARYLFQEGVRASPKNRYAWQAWALFEANQGNRELARRLFKQGHEFNPRDAVLLQAYALFEYGSSNPDIARDLFNQAAAADPKHQPVWIARGWMEWKEGNLDIARRYYKKSLSIDSGSMDAARTFHAWGILEERAGNFSGARELYKYALQVDSQNAPAWTSWAKLEENIGNTIRAEEIRNQYLQQRTEVVDEAPWDMNLTSMLAPAFDKIKEFLKIEASPKSDATVTDSPEKQRLDLDIPQVDQAFDIEAFLRGVIPWKYKSESMNS